MGPAHPGVVQVPVEEAPAQGGCLGQHRSPLNIVSHCPEREREAERDRETKGDREERERGRERYGERDKDKERQR